MHLRLLTMGSQFLLIQFYMLFALNISGLPLIPTHTTILNEAHPMTLQISGVYNPGVQWHRGGTEIQDQHNLYAFKNPNKIRKDSQRKSNRKMMNVKEESYDLHEIKSTYDAYARENQKESKPSGKACFSFSQRIGRHGKEKVLMSGCINDYVVKTFLFLNSAKDWLEGLWVH